MENAQNPNDMSGQGGQGMPGNPPSEPAMMTPPPVTPAPESAPMPEPTPAPAAEQPRAEVPPVVPMAAATGTPHAGERRVMAAMSYLGALCLIPLLFARDSEFAQYHAKQGLILAIIGFALKIVSDLLWNIPFGGALSMIAGIALLVVSIMGIVKAFNGERFEIPHISEWAKKVNF
ncbi:MAG: DUF4870 domain-containing protein [Patescibacteria group bacterium]